MEKETDSTDVAVGCLGISGAFVLVCIGITILAATLWEFIN